MREPLDMRIACAFCGQKGTLKQQPSMLAPMFAEMIACSCGGYAEVRYPTPTLEEIEGDAPRRTWNSIKWSKIETHGEAWERSNGAYRPEEQAEEGEA